MIEKLNNHMGRTKKVRARTIVLCALAVCAMLTYAFLPEVLSVGWHLFHGNSAKFLVWNVPVPWGWRELNGNNFIVIQKLERWVPKNNPASEVIVTTLDLHAGSGTDHEQWKKASIETELERGHHFISENEVQLDGETGFCFTFTDNEHSDRRWINCVFPTHRLSIGYIGTKDHSQVFDSIIQKVSASK